MANDHLLDVPQIHCLNSYVVWREVDVIEREREIAFNVRWSMYVYIYIYVYMRLFFVFGCDTLILTEYINLSTFKVILRVIEKSVARIAFLSNYVDVDLRISYSNAIIKSERVE